MKKKIPIILFGRDYWNKVIYFEYLCVRGLIEEKHLSIFKYADNTEEDWALIKKFNNSN